MGAERSAGSGNVLAGLPLVEGSSELAGLVRERDWSGTPLGSIEEWPQSLRTVVSILLTSRYAMWIGWGKDLTFLYNDAYRPTLELKHAWALGSAASKVWAEIWRDIGPRIETVLSTGRATYDEGLSLILERSGFPEETHTFSYSPLFGDDRQVNGMLRGHGGDGARYQREAHEHAAAAFRSFGGFQFGRRSAQRGSAATRAGTSTSFHLQWLICSTTAGKRGWRARPGCRPKAM